MQVKVSILLFEFNGELFIEESLRTVLAQRTDFDFELVAGEPGSADGTRAVLDRLEAENSGRLRIVRRASGSSPPIGFVDAYARCTGEYLALMEAGDYWVDSHKLQRQVDWLDAHPEHVFCFHDVRVLSSDPSENGRVVGASTFVSQDRNEFHLADLIRSRFVPGGSVVLRGDRVGRLPDWLGRIRRVDWLLTLLAARSGPFSRIFDVVIDRRARGGIQAAVDDMAEPELAEQEYRLLKSVLPRSTWSLLDTKLEAIDIARRKAWCVKTLENFVEIEQRWTEEEAKLRAYISTLEAHVDEREQRRAALLKRRDEASPSPRVARWRSAARAMRVWPGSGPSEG